MKKKKKIFFEEKYTRVVHRMNIAIAYRILTITLVFIKIFYFISCVQFAIINFIIKVRRCVYIKSSLYVATYFSKNLSRNKCYRI